jgi:hypothetical protein
MTVNKNLELKGALQKLEEIAETKNYSAILVQDEVDCHQVI